MNATKTAQDVRSRAARLNDLARKREAKRPAAKKAIAASTLAPAPVAVDVPRLDVRDMQALEAFTTVALAAGEESTIALLRDLLDGAPRVPVSREARIEARPKPDSGNWGPDDQADRPEWAVEEMGANRAGLRGHLAHAEAYGPEVSRLVVIAFPSGARRPVIAHGPLSAFHRQLPDAASRLTWADAGIYQGKGAGYPAAMELFPLKLDA